MSVICKQKPNKLDFSGASCNFVCKCFATKESYICFEKCSAICVQPVYLLFHHGSFHTLYSTLKVCPVSRFPCVKKLFSRKDYKHLLLTGNMEMDLDFRKPP